MRMSRWLVAVLVITLLTACDVETTGTAPAVRSGPSVTATIPAGWEHAHVIRVVDGDTILVRIDGQDERVRYIGVDTPETVRPNSPVECFGAEASRENRRLVEGRTIYLEKDISERDRFGRLLRYVYVDNPTTGERLFVNLELVRNGFANVITYPPDVRHEHDFRAAEREAREEGRGLWGTCR
jgi:micrococcal nuclease